MTKRIMAVGIVLVAVCLAAALTPGLWAQPPGGTDALRSLSELQPTATARQAMRGDKFSPGKRTDAPPTAPAQGGPLIWFNDRVAFEEFNKSEGKVLKGIEDFEESILNPNSADALDDPLESGVPNLPDGFPFPVGMTGLPNLIVQSNLGGGNPSDENPRGVEGLAAASAPLFGAVSDVVFSGVISDSLDLIFTDEKSGVGFNTLTFFVGASVEVRVYSTTNVFLGMMTTPADPSGANFLGVWSDIPIGRINIFSSGGGAEGGDNIQAWEEGPPGGVDFFLNADEFELAVSKAGKVLKGVEEYPWSAGPGSVLGVDDPLDVNTSVPGWIQPGVLLDNITYQSNLDPFGANGPNPRGGTGLALFTTGFIGATHNGLVANHFVDSLDILSGPPAGDNHTAMGMQVVSFNNSPGGSAVTVSVYNKDDKLIGTLEDISAPANQGGAFVGLLVKGEDTIGRINLYDTNPGFDAEGLYELAVYVLGEPCPWDLDGGGDVGVGDLLILLANWANPYGVPDLLRMLANWGPCP